MNKRKPELVAPAGDWPALVTAVDSGADSVYFGVKGLNMRNFAGNFDVLELKKIMDFLHKRKKKGYLALNVIIKNKELNKVERILRQAKSARVDAVVLWDMAVLSLAKKLKLKIHLSTQASVSNIKALSFYAQLGVKRIILARECTLCDIQQMLKFMRQKRIQCEIETFIHGAMCISISGRCFLSGYTSGKSANRGECLQYCRREFSIYDQEQEAEYVLGKDYILSAKDLCTIDFIDKLIESGISAFKIEGRRRSPEYIKIVTSVYRKAIDAFYDRNLNDTLKKSYKKQLRRVFNRGFSSGFYLGYPDNSVSRKTGHSYEKIFLGEVKKFFKKINVAEILMQNAPLEKGEQLLFVGNKTPACIACADQIQQNHKFVEIVNKGELAGVKLPFIVKPKDKVFFWRKK